MEEDSGDNYRNLAIGPYAPKNNPQMQRAKHNQQKKRQGLKQTKLLIQRERQGGLRSQILKSIKPRGQKAKNH
jgi:hypothetical protein